MGGFAGTVYARSRRVAHRAMEESLRARAEALAGLLEVGKDGLEFETSPGTMPGLERRGSGAYAVITGPDGKVVVRSPSVGDERLPAPPPWEEGLVRFEDLEAGPDGIPCAMVTMAFTARGVPANGGGRDAAASEAARRFRIQVALDSRARDRELAELAAFLAIAGSAALVLTLGAGFLLSRAVLRPVQRMTEEAASLTPEDASRRLHPGTVVAELHSLAATLNFALDRLGAALERQRRLTSDASHELRTPVSVLMANAELLLRRPRTAEEYREGLERQLRTARRMKDIVENLLVLARADAGAESIARVPVDLSEVLDSGCDEFLPLAEDRGVRIVKEIEPGVRVPGDGRYLAQLASNLLSNAVKFTPAGGAVTVRLARAGGRAEMAVSDTGPGIPEKHLEHVRERFYRVAEGRNEAEGAGLGLAIADWIARAHGGEMEIASRPGEGSTFRVRFPKETA